MNHFVKDISIENFKSIQKVEIKDCSRINIFIGEPNVGKSNILEALAIAGLPYHYRENESYFTECIRPYSKTDLFHNGDSSKNLSINVLDKDKNRIGISYTVENIINFTVYSQKWEIGEKGNAHFFIGTQPNCEKDVDFIEVGLFSYFPISKYNFLLNAPLSNTDITYKLIPPFGRNLSAMLAEHKHLMKELQELFKKYSQKLVLDRSDNSLRILKNTDTEDGFVFLLPYSSVADSLQRLIFYKAAVASNQNAILLFEEPEAHTFPPYISKLTYDIIQSTTNQFFITTHSPVIVNDFMENAQADLSVFMVDFKNDQTVVHKLTKEEIHRVYQYGIDLFYNYESFVGA